LRVFFLLILWAPATIYAQVLGQDSNGFSSILLPAANINVDGTNNVITLSYTQFVHKTSKFTANEKPMNIDIYFNDFVYENTEQANKKFNRDLSDFKNNNKEFLGRNILLGLEFLGKSTNEASLILNNGLLATKAMILGSAGIEWTTKSYDRNYIAAYAQARRSLVGSQSKLTELFQVIENKIAILKRENNLSDGKAKLFLNNLKIEDKKDRLLGVKQNIEYLKEMTPDKDLLSREKEIEHQSTKLNLIQGNLEKAIQLFPKVVEEEDEKQPETISNLSLLQLYKLRHEILTTLEEINKEYSKWDKIKIDRKLDDYQTKSTWIQYNEELRKKVADLSMREKFFVELYRVNKQELKELKNEFENYTDALSNVVLLEKELIKLDNKLLDFNKHILYGRAGFSGTSFRYDLDNDSTQIQDRFEKRDFQGTRFEIGYTYQLKSVNYFGFNISKEYSDNSATLTPTKYKFKTIDESTTPNLEVSKELEAMSGPYDKFDEFQLAVDYVRMVPLKDVYNQDDGKNKRV